MNALCSLLVPHIFSFLGLAFLISGSFGLTGRLALQPIKLLSGGQKSRLILADITCDAPQALLLDEPTNHLDLEACEALLDALRAFRGTVVLVSHDRHFIESLGMTVYELRAGRLRRLEGSLGEYVAAIEARIAARRD